MPNHSKPRGSRRRGSSAERDSECALLERNRQQHSAGRRYGPTASSTAAGFDALLSSSYIQGKPEAQHLVRGLNKWSSDSYEDDGWDDYLRNPEPGHGKLTFEQKDARRPVLNMRGLSNSGCLVLLLACLVTLFVGYPLISHFTQATLSTNGAYNLGGINSTGQVPLIDKLPSLVDRDTPSSTYTRVGYDGEEYNLVFSDEFNRDGRTFYPGDDPYWTAVDIHYWSTNDLEWYDPSAITTKDGNLVITMNQESINNLNFKSGMLQSWNQLCFQYSVYIEVRLSLPGSPGASGFWPGVWMMGNLGRPGYGATTEGTWPYTYDSCDLGTLKNQTNASGTGPPAATNPDGTPLSYLPGQRMSACTCKGEDHAGPDVSYGRGVPEIDVLEGGVNVTASVGQVSQSMQVAPFDAAYEFVNTSNGAIIYNTTKTSFNSYKGGQYQQAVSSLTNLDSSVYQLTSGGFGVYGFEYYTSPSSRTSGHVTWVAEGEKAWTLYPAAIAPNAASMVSQRLISEEPMAMNGGFLDAFCPLNSLYFASSISQIINFGMSDNFQAVDYNHLSWPAQMLVDYVRVYQRSDGKVGCDPADRPTSDYISRHLNAYSNPNLTTWEQAGYTMPKNSLIDNCT
ncbi:Beta-glucan synthesis-associated protein KRE6 [Saitozyma sp. JCM 24511]|nr:Beta-glucan synthesis-associated protein KRE6 [Saitozyma sp. JCM 24511]